MQTPGPLRLRHCYAVAVLGIATICGAQAAYANPITAAWVAIFDGTNSENYAIASSLNDSGYLNPVDTAGNGLLGGAYLTQAGAVAFDVQEGQDALGQASVNLEYADPTPLAIGTALIVNFNISGPDEPSGLLSDTLSITFTGHNDGTNNMSIDGHFLSGNDAGLYPFALPNAIAIVETGGYQDLTEAIRGPTGLSAFHLEFTSEVAPEPASLMLIAIGLAGIGSTGLRRNNHALQGFGNRLRLFNR